MNNNNIQENNSYAFTWLHLHGKNPLPINIDNTQPWYSFNAYIPWGSKDGIQIYWNLKERTGHINKRDFEMAWLDYADYSHDFNGFMDEGSWLQAYWLKYGKVNN